MCAAPVFKQASPDEPPESLDAVDATLPGKGLRLWVYLSVQCLIILILAPVFFSQAGVLTPEWINPQQPVYSRSKVVAADNKLVQSLFAEQKQLAIVTESSNNLRRSTLSPDWSTVLPFSTGISEGEFFNSSDITKLVTEPKPGAIRLRLGDVVDVRDHFITEVPIFAASIFDERYRINEIISNPAETANQLSRSKLQRDEIKLARLLDMVIPKAYAASNLNSPPELIKTAAEKKAPPPSTSLRIEKEQVQSPTKEIQPSNVAPPEKTTLDPRQQTINQGNEPAQQSREYAQTTGAAVTSATMLVLNKADALRKKRVVLPLLGVNDGLYAALDIEASANAMARGIAQVSPQLQFVREIYIYSPNFIEGHEVLSKVTNILLVAGDNLAERTLNAYSLPLGPSVLSSVLPAVVAGDGDKETLVKINTAYQYTAKDTVLPLLMMLVVYLGYIYGWFGISARRKYFPQHHLVKAFMATFLLIVGFYIVNISVGLDSWFHTEIGLSATISIMSVIAVLWTGSPSKLDPEEEFEEATLKTQEENEQEVKTILFRDTPIDEVAQDKLGFNSTVEALAKFLDNKETVPPLTISVNGPWGSGKSSLMKMLATRLEETGRWRKVWFNAWHYQKQDQILAAFLKTITTSLTEDWKFRFGLRLAWVRFKKMSFQQYVFLFAPLILLVIWIIDSEVAKGVVGNAPAQGSEGLKPVTTFALWVVGLGGGGWIYKQVFMPFRLQFKKLYNIKDQSKRIGFLDEFTKEFELFREAIGPSKFLIIIDDLDRCAPDHIVEVMKTINLITTSGVGAQRSFFMLGYDRKYIIKSIEEHFKEYAKDGEVVDEYFGANYLKKIVTLSISVPSVESDKVYGLVDAIRSYRQRSDLSRDKKAGTWVGKIRTLVPAWFRSLAAAIIVCGGIVFLVVNPPMTKQSGETIGSISTIPPSAELADAPGDTQIVTVSRGDTAVVMAPLIPQWMTALIVLMGLSAYIVYVRWVRPKLEDSEYEQEAEDSHEFNSALNKCANALPVNPRDAIRLVNRMRFEYLMQDERYKAASNIALPIKLSELESLTYTLLNYHHPGYLNPDFVDHVIIPEINNNQVNDPKDLIAKLSGKYPDIAKVSKTFTLLENMPQDNGKSSLPTNVTLDHFVNPDKLQAYVKLNRFVLVSEKLKEESVEPIKSAGQVSIKDTTVTSQDQIYPELDEKIKKIRGKQAKSSEEIRQD